MGINSMLFALAPLSGTTLNGLFLLRGGLVNSDRSLVHGRQYFPMTAGAIPMKRPRLTGIQGTSGFGRLERREDARAACSAS
jgi:hypothetical protein